MHRFPLVKTAVGAQAAEASAKAEAQADRAAEVAAEIQVHQAGREALGTARAAVNHNFEPTPTESRITNEK